MENLQGALRTAADRARPRPRTAGHRTATPAAAGRTRCDGGDRRPLPPTRRPREAAAPRHRGRGATAEASRDRGTATEGEAIRGLERRSRSSRPVGRPGTRAPAANPRAGALLFFSGCGRTRRFPASPRPAIMRGQRSTSAGRLPAFGIPSRQSLLANPLGRPFEAGPRAGGPEQAPARRARKQMGDWGPRRLPPTWWAAQDRMWERVVPFGGSEGEAPVIGADAGHGHQGDGKVASSRHDGQHA